MDPAEVHGLALEHRRDALDRAHYLVPFKKRVVDDYLCFLYFGSDTDDLFISNIRCDIQKLGLFRRSCHDRTDAHVHIHVPAKETIEQIKLAERGNWHDHLRDLTNVTTAHGFNRARHVGTGVGWPVHRSRGLDRNLLGVLQAIRPIHERKQGRKRASEPQCGPLMALGHISLSFSPPLIFPSFSMRVL